MRQAENFEVYELFRQSALARGEQACIVEAKGDGYRSHSYRETLRDVEALARALAAYSSEAERLALVSENRYEWWVVYLAAMAVGWTVIPLDPQLKQEEWGELLKPTQAKVLFFSENLRFDLQQIQAKVPALTKIFTLGKARAGEASLEDLLAPPSSPPAPIEKLPPNPDRIATLVFTSGTQGQPKGVLLSQRNLVSNARVINLGYEEPGETLATILPLHHMYGFAVSLIGLLTGKILLYFSNLKPETIAQAMRDYRPHFFIAVPAFYERLAAGILQQIRETTPKWFSRRFEKALEGYWAGQAFRGRWFKKILFRKVHRRLGGRLHFLASGGAPMEPRWIQCFNLLGFNFFEGYGLTETSPLITCNDRRGVRIGSVGRAMPGIEVKIQDPDAWGIGEVLCRGPNVMQAYFQDVAGTAEAIDDEGWFHTGDLGYLDPDGFLFLSGRMRELIVTANGKKVFPAEVEQELAKIPLVREACVFGIQKNPTSRGEIVHAQIFPDREEARRRGVRDAETTIREGVEAALATLPDYKRPRSLGFSEQAFPRTTTLKIKKFEVAAAYRKELQNPAPKPEALEGEWDTPEGRTLEKILEPYRTPGVPLSVHQLLSLDLGMDSLTLMEFWKQVQDAWSIQVSPEQVFEIRSLGQVLDFVRENGGVKASPAIHGKQGFKTSFGFFPLAVRNLFLFFFRLGFHLLGSLKAQGLENLPRHGGFILAPNHESFLDFLFLVGFLPSDLKKRLVVMVDDDFFLDKKLLRSVVMRFGPAIVAYPDRPAQDIMAESIALLESGKILLIFPEGVRTPDGKLQPFRSGVARLAQETGVPIVPVFLEGAYEFWPKRVALPRPRGHIEVHFGKPLSPKDFQADAAGARDLTQALQERILELSQEVARAQ